MDAPTIREQAFVVLENMSDENVAEILKFMLILKEEDKHLANYDPAKDPVLTGEDLFDGPGDLSIRDEEILYGDDPREDE